MRQLLTRLIFVSSLCLWGCDHQASLQQHTSISSAIASPSPTLHVQPTLANYVIYNDVAELESTADLVIVGNPQTSIEDTQQTFISESEKAKKKPKPHPRS